MRCAVKLTLVVVGLALPHRGFAEPAFLDLIPNSENPELNRGRPCGICHVRPQGGGDRNVFGRDFGEALGFAAWRVAYALDSDGDGQSNGLEMGDPEGVWRPGDAPARTTDLSLPADASSLSFQPPPDAGTTDAAHAVDARSADASSNFDAGVPKADATAPDVPGATGLRDDASIDAGCRCTAAGGGPGGASWLLGLGVIASRLRSRAARRTMRGSATPASDRERAYS